MTCLRILGVPPDPYADSYESDRDLASRPLLLYGMSFHFPIFGSELLGEALKLFRALC